MCVGCFILFDSVFEIKRDYVKPVSCIHCWQLNSWSKENLKGEELYKYSCFRANPIIYIVSLYTYVMKMLK